MTRLLRISILLLVAKMIPIATLQLRAQELELIPTGSLTYDQKTGELVAEDGGQIIYGDWLLTADYIRYNQETGDATARGNVVFSRHDLRLTAAFLTYKPKEEFARAENFRAGNGQVYVDGSLLEGNPDNFRFEDINFYPGEPGTFLFEARAGEVALIDRNLIRGKRLFFKVGPVPFLLIPNITQPLDAETNLFKPTLDYSGHIGASLGAEILAPVSQHIRLGGNLALTTKRGVLFGPAGRYNFQNDDYVIHGSLISGYIDDQGEPGLDVNDNPIDNDRYFAEWLHQQTWSDNRANLNAYLRYWSDSEVTRDFYEDAFDEMQDPDSYLEVNYNGRNWQLSLFARAALGDFQSYTERLPELRFSFFPTELGYGFSNSGFVAATHLRRAADLDHDVSGSRIDAFYGLEWNRALADGVNLRLKAGARGMRYDDAESRIEADVFTFPEPYVQETSVSGNRAFGELGADLNFKAHGTFELKNETWNIDGLRHIIEPRISYRYVPELENDDSLQVPGVPESAFFGPPYGDSILYADRWAFANYLPAIDIENRRDVDTLREDHKFRFELRNRLQTRHKDGGSRDLARFDISSDYYLKGSDYAEEESSLVNFDFELTPAPWLEVGVFARFDPEDGFSNQEFNPHIALQDEGYWRIVVGSHFLDGLTAAQYESGFYDSFEPGYFQPLWPNYGMDYPTYRNLRIEQYYAHFEYQFSENFKLYATARYDDETGVFYEQRIGLLQRALDRYGLKYELRIYDGDRREEDFGISIGIDLFDDLF